MVRDAVLHNLQIIGEATKRTAHAYFDIDPEIIWDVVSSKLEPLRAAVAKLLGALAQ